MSESKVFTRTLFVGVPRVCPTRRTLPHSGTSDLGTRRGCGGVFMCLRVDYPVPHSRFVSWKGVYEKTDSLKSVCKSLVCLCLPSVIETSVSSIKKELRD